MKERPILFSAPMVRAILNGTKTQTRRIAPISRLDIKEHDGGMVTWSAAFSKPIKGVLSSHSGGKFSVDQASRIVASQFCPHGQPGDRLWVREAFQPLLAEGVDHRRADWDTGKGYAVSYPATDGIQEYIDADDNLKSSSKPSIHMPRWASRITLEVTGVRAERLWDISEADAVAEGIGSITVSDGGASRWINYYAPDSKEWGFGDARSSYRSLWEQINGSDSWYANPWVWVVEFKRLEAA